VWIRAQVSKNIDSPKGEFDTCYFTGRGPILGKNY
jgi:hypothetical protein